MIREATADDIPALIDMGMRFHAGSAYSDLLNPSKAVIADSLANLIASDTCTVFVDCRDDVLVGAILGAIIPHFVTGELTCAELSWWVDQEHRGGGPKLLDRLEEWAIENGASRMAVTEPPGNPRVGELYVRLGYRLVEKTYMKAL